MYRPIVSAPVALLALMMAYPASSTEILAPGSSVAGKSIAAWSADWWTWAWNSPAGADPLGDTSGVLANQNNNGPVFFLAGSNSNGLVQRSFDVPYGKPLLVPMINYWENCPGDVAVSCGPGYLPDPKSVMMGNVAYYQAAVTSLFVVVDGTPLASPLAHWEVSDFFSGGVAASGTAIVGLYASFGIDIVGQDLAPSLASGYYAMVTGLAAGPHTIIYGGSTTAFGPFDYQVSASINVAAVPEPQILLLMLAGLGVVGWATQREAVTSR